MSELRLHPITWIIAIAGIASLFADFMETAAVVKALNALSVLPGDYGNQGRGEIFAKVIKNFAYSVSYLGTAAMVEFLFRIWRELRSRNAPAAGAEPA